MKSFTKALSVLLFTSGVIACSTPDDPFRELSKIEGEWTMRFDGGNEVVETWVKINDTLYAGKSYEVTGGDSVLTENIQLVKSNNEVLYIPTVEHQNDRLPVVFKLTKHEHGNFIFENPGHDFPSTITYEFRGTDSLNATISGTIKGELRSMEFEYEKK